MTNWKEKYPIGSQWKTRGDEPETLDSGWKAVVVSHSADGPIVCHVDDITDVEEVCTVQHDPKGIAMKSPFCPGDGDLIEPWKEPRTGEFWVNVYEFDGIPYQGEDFDSREEADAEVIEVEDERRRRIACVGPIKWTEGEGMEDSE